MSIGEPSSDTRRFAADASGVLHEVIDYRPRSGTYVALCGAILPARSTAVLRARWAPGVLCGRCRDAVAAGVI